MYDAFESVKAVAANMPTTGEKGAYSSDMFLKDFPQFTSAGTKKSLVPASMLDGFIENANNSVLPTRWSSMWRYAAGLYVAHFVSLYLQTYSEGSLNSAQAANSGQQVGVVKRATMGSDTIEYDNSAITAATNKWGAWNSTKYGQQLVTIARLVGMGGTYAI